MLLGILTLITALSISAVAIYYSVAGLVAIFAAAALPIMIMGGTLEIAKLVTAVWLHRYWSQATWWLKTYLATAVVVLMLITSMGIFGFLSKAHIEQTSASEESIAKAEVIQNEIDRQLGIISRAENRIKTLESSTSDNSADIQAQIDKEQERIDNAYTRIQPAIEEQNKIISGVTALFQQELDRIDQEVATLQGYIDNGETKKAQQMIGASADGIFGAKTADKIGEWQAAKRAERAEWLQKIQEAANSPTVVAARDEIARLRNKADQQIADSNILINRLRDQLGNTDNAEEIQKAIDEQNDRVRTASSEIDSLTEEKIAIEAEYRKLEAEVGPIKYIAEFIYGNDANNNMLEEAVRWVIIIIIFVFDPLAVLLLIASQYTFEYRRKDDNGGWLRQYEQARAQRIVDNPGYTVDDPKEASDEEDRREVREEAEQDAQELRTGQEEESVSPEMGNDPTLVEENERVEDVQEPTTTTNDTVGDTVSEADTPVADVPTFGMEQSEVQIDDNTKREIAEGYAELVPGTFDSDNVEKKDTESSEESRLSEQELDERESLPEWQDAKTRWKQEHPNLTLKTFKQQYLDGKIDKLPWEDYLEKKTYIMKNKDNTQVKRETKPEFTEVIEPEGYIQNAEQNESTLWKKLKDGK